MRYWLYSEGNIIGPYTPADLLGLPAFGQGSLVCPEHATGAAAEDWKPAEQVAEISAAMSVGVGGVVDGGGVAGFYSMESGYPSGAGQYYDYKFQDGTSYSSALEAIESVLGAYKDEPVSAYMKPEDEDKALLDKFDVRLSKIQEELEAARWEKNLLLEKMRLKDTEEQKTRERMVELEARLKDALDGRFPRTEAHAASAGDTMAHGVPVPSAPVPDSAPEKGEDHPRHEEILEETRKVEEFSKKEITPSAGAAAPEAAEGTPCGMVSPSEEEAPRPEVKPSKPLKSFKSMKPSQTLKRENLLGDDDEEAENPVGKRSLKSLGYAKAKRILGDEAEDEAGEEYEEEAPTPAPIPGSALVYDFTVVTPRHEPVKEKINFKIQPLDEPPLLPGPEAAPARAAAPAPAPAPAPAAGQQPFKPVETFQREPVLPSFTGGDTIQRPVPAAASAGDTTQHGVPVPSVPTAASIVFSPGSPAAEFKPAPAAATPAEAAKDDASPDKTLRLPTADIKTAGDTMAHGVPAAPRKGRGKVAFLVVMIIFAAIAAGGISFFFLGDGISLSDFSMIGSPSKKAVEDEPAPEAAQTEGAQPDVLPAAGEPEAATPTAQPEPPHQPASNESTRKAVETVKNHRLPGGRGSIEAWFSNSFLSSSAGGMNEEWSATVLHGDIFVVQYRLLRPKLDPLVYQFEVDVAKGMIVRGINNSAIELMDFPSGDKVTAAARPAPKAAAKPAAKKAARPAARPRSSGGGGQIPILPLPDDESPAARGDTAPTGFENVDVNDERVRYIVAQESDDELF